MKGTRFLQTIWALLGAHVLFLGLAIGIRNAEPTHNLYLTTQRESVMIFGYNSFGYRVFRQFPSWRSAADYLRAHHIDQPTITFAQRGLADDAIAYKVAKRAYYKVVWNRQMHEPQLLYAPDALAAVQMAEYVKYYGLTPSPFGFSLPLN
jgi:hypothetical protein